MKSQNNTLAFNTLFNDLHNILTKLLDTSEKRDFSFCLNDIRERANESALFDRIDDTYMNDLKTINAIRNILIHKNEWIEVPSKTIDALRNTIMGIRQLERNFHTHAGDIFGKNIFTAKDTDTLESLLEAMASRNFSHVPVYMENGKFRGVFSLKSIVLWINKSKGIVDKNILIRDVPIDTKSSEYLFISSDTTVSNIESYFKEYSRNRKKLGAIFLTSSGKPDTPIEGIITPWDLPLIYTTE